LFGLDYIDITDKIDSKTGANGYLTLTGIAARSGLIKYNGYNEYLSVNELENSLDSIIGVPITLEHEGGILALESVKSVAVGAIVDATIVNDSIKVKISLFSTDSVQGIRDGKLSLSCGYKYNQIEVDKLDNLDYKFLQCNRVYNHVAVVQNPRVEGCTISLDNSGGTMTENLNFKTLETNTDLKLNTMSSTQTAINERLDGLHSVLNAINERLDSADKKRLTVEAAEKSKESLDSEFKNTFQTLWGAVNAGFTLPKPEEVKTVDDVKRYVVGLDSTLTYNESTLDTDYQVALRTNLSIADQGVSEISEDKQLTARQQFIADQEV